MNDFTFYMPTKVVFGKGVERRAGEELKKQGAARVLLHFGGQSAKKSGLLDRVEESLNNSGIPFVSLGGVKPNPRLSLVREGIKLVRKEKVDYILAVGGGSVIDSAKAIALGALYDGDVWDIYEKKAEPKAALPVATVLTLAAAGSETSESSVITNEEGWLKKGFSHDLIRPRFSLLNPELLYSLPAYQTACGIVDIMMHTMERYFSPGGTNEMSDRIAEQVLRNAVYYGEIAVQEPENYEARSEIMWTGSIAHNNLTGLGRQGDWATHQLEHELSGLFDVAHGAGLAAMWGAWAKYVYQKDVKRFARFGANVWDLPYQEMNPQETALAAIEATMHYFSSIGMPVSIKELLGRNVTEEELHILSEKCTFFGTRTIGSFMVLDYDEIKAIYQGANQV